MIGEIINNRDKVKFEFDDYFTENHLVDKIFENRSLVEAAMDRLYENFRIEESTYLMKGSLIECLRQGSYKIEQSGQNGWMSIDRVNGVCISRQQLNAANPFYKKVNNVRVMFDNLGVKDGYNIFKIRHLGGIETYAKTPIPDEILEQY